MTAMSISNRDANSIARNCMVVATVAGNRMHPHCLLDVVTTLCDLTDEDIKSIKSEIFLMRSEFPHLISKRDL